MDVHKKQAAARSKNAYLTRILCVLSARRGRKKATLALAHTALVIAYRV